MRCAIAQERLSTALVAQTDLRDLLAAEDHAARCLRCADTIRDLAALSVALDRAYAPLRSRTAALSPARVHLALRAPARPRSRTGASQVLGKVNELAMAAAVMAFVMIGALPQPRADTVVNADINAGPIRLTPGHVDVPMQVSVSVRIGRYLLHDTLLDPRVVPVEAPNPEASALMRLGQPY